MKIKSLDIVIALTTILASCGGGDTTVQDTKDVLSAKNATLSSQTYVYDYSLYGSVKFAGIKTKLFPVQINGKVQHSNVAKDGTNHFEKREVSGLLAIDSTTYKYNDGNSYITVSSNEKKDFSVADSSTIPASYDFENNCVGKIFKSLDDNGNISAKKSGDKYRVHLKTNFASSSILSLANFLDSGKIIKVLNKYLAQWHSSVDPECYIKLASDNKTVQSFEFNVGISIKSIVDVNLSFKQNFSKINEDISFEKPKFTNTIVDKTKIESNLNDVKSSFDNSKNSYYKYYLKTTVDHGCSQSNPLGLAVNSTSQGYAERKVVDNNVYFHNELELDSDYKNKDQYPEYVEDYKYTRANVTNDDYETYDVIKHTLLDDEYFEIPDYDNHDVDDYYMLPDKTWFNTDNVKIMRKTTKDDVSTYKFGITTDCVKNILKHYNKSIRLDKDRIKWIDVYEGFGNFNVKNSEYIIEVENSKINSIELDLKGFYDMKETDDVKFRLELKINFDYSKAEYKVPEKKTDIK